MKESREIWVYQHNKFITKTPSAKEAAELADTSSTTVRKIAKQDIPCTRDGYVFTYNQLTDEEIKNLPDSNKTKQKLKRVGKECLKQVNKQEYIVDCKNGLVGFIPTKKEEKKRMLRKMVYTKLRDRWMSIPEKVATLERQLISELIDSL